MRIIAGEAKGRPLNTLRGSALRPTSERVRAALFSILGDRVSTGPFLDLYAGTGAVGLEALSRGAPRADFVEYHRAACAILRENVARAGFQQRARVICASVGGFLNTEPDCRYAVVFVDPPYARGEAERVFPALARWPGVDGATLVVWQHGRRERAGVQGAAEDPVRTGEGLVRVRVESYGDTMLSFFRMGAIGGGQKA